MRRLFLLWLPVLYLFAALGMPQQIQAQSSNLATNGGFESGTWDGWTRSGTTGLTSTSSQVRSGTYAASIGTGTGNGTITAAQVSLQSGIEYRVAVWVNVRTDTTGSPRRITVTFFLNGASNGTCVVEIVSGGYQGGSYVECAQVVVGSSAHISVTDSTYGAGYVDDFSVTAITQPTPTAVPTATPLPTPTPVPDADEGKICYQAAKALVDAFPMNYCWGGDAPGSHPELQGDKCPSGSGMDCSGSFIWGYKQAGANWSDTTAQGLFSRLVKVGGCTLSNLDCWEVGDAVFLGVNRSASQIYHVAMFVGVTAAGPRWADCFNTAYGCLVHDVRSNSAYINDFVAVGRPSVTYGWTRCGASAEFDAIETGDGSWFDIWAPIRWLANQIRSFFDGLLLGIKNLFLPSDQFWVDFKGRLLALMKDREPMGTLVEMTELVRDVRTGVLSLDASVGFSEASVATMSVASSDDGSLSVASSGGSSTWSGGGSSSYGTNIISNQIKSLVTTNFTFAGLANSVAGFMDFVADSMGVYAHILRGVTALAAWLGFLMFIRRMVYVVV